jgi:hypothetical protein
LGLQGATKPQTDLPPTPAIVIPSAPLSAKKAWIDHMEQTLPGLLCSEKHYFVQCYQVTPKECSNITKLLVHACLNNVAMALPENINAEQGEHWGKMIGRCSFDLYDKYLASKKRDTADCHPPKQP